MTAPPSPLSALPSALAPRTPVAKPTAEEEATKVFESMCVMHASIKHLRHIPLPRPAASDSPTPS